MIPGMTKRPVASISVTSFAAGRPVPTALILPFTTRTSALVQRLAGCQGEDCGVADRSRCRRSSGRRGAVGFGFGDGQFGTVEHVEMRALEGITGEGDIGVGGHRGHRRRRTRRRSRRRTRRRAGLCPGPGRQGALGWWALRGWSALGFWPRVRVHLGHGPAASGGPQRRLLSAGPRSARPDRSGFRSAKANLYFVAVASKLAVTNDQVGGPALRRSGRPAGPHLLSISAASG